MFRSPTAVQSEPVLAFSWQNYSFSIARTVNDANIQFIKSTLHALKCQQIYNLLHIFAFKKCRKM